MTTLRTRGAAAALALAWMLVWAVWGSAAAQAASAAIIGGADGPTAIFVAGGALTEVIEAQLPWYAFGPMDEATQRAAAAQLGAVAEDYVFTGRVSLDGEYGYIAGTLKPGRNPASAADPLPDGTRVFWDAGTPDAMILVPGAYVRERGFGTEYSELYARITSGDLASLADATRRGVTVCAPPAPYLSVYMLKGGQYRYEYISLTEADLKSAAADGYTFKPEAIGDAMRLVTSDAEDADSEPSIPASLYAMAAKRCGFTVASPKDIGTIVRAEMTFAPREGAPLAQVVEDKKSLKDLASLLKRAKKTGLGNCPFDAVLTMIMKDGRLVTVQKATDSCGTMVFGSAMCYQISDKDNARFWKIFPEIRSALAR